MGWLTSNRASLVVVPSEFIFLGAQRSKGCRIGRCQKRICFQFVCEDGWYAGLAGGAKLLDLADEFMQVGVVRIDRKGEPGIALGIFVAAADQGVRWQG